jgi:DNA-directed RNA polymerase specialized sigma54-like protein
MFVTSRGHPYAEFQRALKNGNVWVAEAVARELPKVSLDDALKLVHLYAEKESPKYEAAAMKWLRRYLEERSPTLETFAKVVRSLNEACQRDE